MAATKPLKLLAISGSLRKASANTGILRYMQTVLPANVSMDIVVPHNLPLYNADVDAKGQPPPVAELFNKIKAADGIVFGNAEYNYSMTGVMKNAIDWCSRNGNAFGQKPGGIIGAGGGLGAGRSAYHLRQSAVFLDMRIMNHPEIFVRLFEPPQKCNENGDIIDANTQAGIKKFIEAFALFVRKQLIADEAFAEFKKTAKL